MRTRDVGKISHFAVAKEEEGLEYEMPIGKYNQPRNNSQIRERGGASEERYEEEKVMNGAKLKQSRKKKTLASSPGTVQIGTSGQPTITHNNVALTPIITKPTATSSITTPNKIHSPSVSGPRVTIGHSPVTQTTVSAKPTLGTIPEVNSSATSPVHKPIYPPV